MLTGAPAPGYGARPALAPRPAACHPRRTMRVGHTRTMLRLPLRPSPGGARLLRLLRLRLRASVLAGALAGALAAAGGLTGCAALRLPAQDDPDRSRHTFEIQGEVRRADTFAAVPSAELTVEGAREVIGDVHADGTGRFWLKVSGVTPLPGPARAGGPAGAVLVSARGGDRCVPPTRVTLPTAGPVILLAGACPAP